MYEAGRIPVWRSLARKERLTQLPELTRHFVGFPLVQVKAAQKLQSLFLKTRRDVLTFHSKHSGAERVEVEVGGLPGVSAITPENSSNAKHRGGTGKKGRNSGMDPVVMQAHQRHIFFLCQELDLHAANELNWRM